jgi:predicted alpha/beta hydrolase family esterase
MSSKNFSKIINIPGIYNSGPQHWQTQWESLNSRDIKRVHQDNWDQPCKDPWIQRLQEQVAQYEEPVLVTAHSLGCNTLVHWANEYDTSMVKGALLVAPADTEASNNPCIQSFNPMPLIRLPFPSIVVASLDDPYCAMEKAARWAAYWGSRFICAGKKGHINAASGIGLWNEGLDLLKELKEVAENQNRRNFAA